MAPVPVWVADIVAVVAATAGWIWLCLWALPDRVRRRVLKVFPERNRRVAVPPTPGLTPIQELAARARRLGRRFHQPPAGRSFAKLEGIRRAYDDALADCCAALEVENLIHVLDAGEELDLERARVEERLEAAGLVIRVPS